ncbi:hypothetical protein GOP47_0010102 [Adiantum capillus-veneris]|uniref:PSII 6.1 kDa protein n=1 Tax=Adiantum capillus-veneris TaxID=13818 RepID=A0A9D4ZIG2_ADICA|nr:hypothetical protein GOP47_0010102 [Adiantum capillus-veneris]
MAAAMSTSLSTISSSLIGQSPDATKLRAPARAIAGLPAFPTFHISNSSQRQEKKGSSAGEQVALPAAVLVAAVAQGGSAIALVDDRLSTEGTGLGLGVSNPLLIWILLGVATLIWALFFVYSSRLPPGDDDSGLSL